MLSILAFSISGFQLAHASEAAYVSIQTNEGEINQVEGDVFVYKTLLSDAGEEMVSLIYATDAKGFDNDYSVGVGYYGTYGDPNLTYELSYVDEGSTYDNKHFVDDSISSEGYLSVELDRSGNTWYTYHETENHKSFSCPSEEVCDNMRIVGTATNTDSDLNEIVFAGTFDNLKATAGSTYDTWSNLENDHKCETSTGIKITGGYNTHESKEDTTGSFCETGSFEWLYNNNQASWGT